MYEAVEVFVNIFQAFAITFYLIKCLGVKEGKNRKCAYITGVIVTVLYLHMAHPNGRVCGAKRPKCEAERSHHL